MIYNVVFVLLVLFIIKTDNLTMDRNQDLTMDLHYNIYGEGNTIILLHGGGTDSRVWKDYVDILAHNFKVITYDLRGHGKSPIPTKPVNHIDDLFNLMEKLKVKQASLIGHSLGGQIATDFSILYPEKVSQLILLAPGLTGFKYDQEFASMVKRMWEAVPNVDLMLEIMLNSPEAYAMKLSMKSEKHAFIQNIHRENIIMSLKWKNFDQVWEIKDASDRLEEIGAQVLFILGREDKTDIFKIKQTFEKVSDIRFFEIPAADHGLVITHSEEILKFIMGR